MKSVTHAPESPGRSPCRSLRRSAGKSGDEWQKPKGLSVRGSAPRSHDWKDATDARLAEAAGEAQVSLWSFTVSISGKQFAPLVREVRRAAEAALHLLRREDSVLDVHLIDRALMQKLNCASRGKDEPTNVLSFEGEAFVRGDAPPKKYFGEVFLAPEVIKERGEEIQDLVIHGILHCAGYTHTAERDRIMMEKKEREILRYAR